uniref:Pleckstrin homology domain containing A7 n=1 Tax=Callithrix jacchus TaxID=9483 RepID=A0A8I3WTG8_CALJA
TAASSSSTTSSAARPGCTRAPGSPSTPGPHQDSSSRPPLLPMPHSGGVLMWKAARRPSLDPRVPWSACTQETTSGAR